jgi:hypothetical protein
MASIQWRSCAVVAASVALVACHARPQESTLAVANQGATFEVRLTGCSTTDVTSRRFGHAIRTALLWSSERVHTASYLPCTATMDAVRGTERHTIYRLTRGRDGSYLEEMVQQAPPRDSTRP